MTGSDRRQDLMELRQILYWQWDPIGVRDHFPHNAGEYDRYAWELLGLLEHEAKDDEVAAYLRRAEVEWMEVVVPDEPRRRIAEAVVWWFLHRNGPANEARRLCREGASA